MDPDRTGVLRTPVRPVKPYVRKLSADEDAPEDDARGPYTMEELQLMNDKFSSALAREHTDPWWRRRQR